MTESRLEAQIKRFLMRKLIDRSRVQTFEEAGVLTRDCGLVLRIPSKTGKHDRNFYITIMEQ